MATDTPRSQESTETVTGPHDGADRAGRLDHRYWRCRRCGLERTDPRLREGCFRCGSAADGEPRGPLDDADSENDGVDETDPGEVARG